MQSAFVIGPIIGGYLSDLYDSKSAATIMAVVSVNIVALYAICGLVVYCFTKWD
jgi:MFS family permease